MNQNNSLSSDMPPHVDTRRVRTLEDFRHWVGNLASSCELTKAGNELARGIGWTFVGDDYRRAWSHLFKRARQLDLVYCKHFKRFYKPLPPKPAIGDRVRLTSTGATGTVTGHSRFDVVVSIDVENREAEVSTEYLEKL